MLRILHRSWKNFTPANAIFTQPFHLGKLRFLQSRTVIHPNQSWVSDTKSSHKINSKMDSKIKMKQIFAEDIPNESSDYGSAASRNKVSQHQNVHRSDKQSAKGNILADLFDRLIAEGKNRYLTMEEWDAIGASLNDFGLAKVWPIRLLDSMFFKPQTEGLLELANSLQDYLHQKEYKVSPLFLKVGQMNLLLNQCGDEVHEQVGSIYDQLKHEYEVFDALNLSRIIIALCQTRRWMECVELLDMYSITANLGTVQYSPIVAAAFKYSDDDKAYQLMHVMYQELEQPLETVFLSLLRRDDCSIEDVEKLLNFLQQTEWFISLETVRELESFFKRKTGNSCSTKHLVIKKRPLCTHCGQALEPIITLTDEEFEELRDAFMEKALLKTDIFQNTSPEELASFQSFLKVQGSFDIVIDGLNTAHATVQKAKPEVKAKLLQSVVEYFAVHKKKRVLVLGKLHMHKWPSHVIDRIKDLAECFFTNDSSADDTFVLYAALNSSPHTQFVTRDEFRDHRILLGHKLVHRFKHWQLSQQVPFMGEYYDKVQKRKYLSFKWPNRYHTRVHPTPDGWHIPYDDGQDRASYQVPNTWLCVTKRS